MKMHALRALEGRRPSPRMVCIARAGSGWAFEAGSLRVWDTHARTVALAALRHRAPSVNEQRVLACEVDGEGVCVRVGA